MTLYLIVRVLFDKNVKLFFSFIRVLPFTFASINAKPSFSLFFVFMQHVEEDEEMSEIR